MKYTKGVVIFILTILFVCGCGTSSEVTAESADISETKESIVVEENVVEEESTVAVVDLQSNVSLVEYKTDKAVIVCVENKNDMDVTVVGNITYYTEDGSMLNADTAYLWDCAKNGKGVIWFDAPTDENYNYVDFASFEVQYEVEDAHENFNDDNFQAEFEITTNDSSDGGIVAEFKNNTGKHFDELETICVYYKDGAAVGYTVEMIWGCDGSVTASYSAPKDNEYNSIPFDNCEIFINSTKTYE